MALRSTRDDFQVRKAKHTYGCAGNGNLSVRRHAEACERRIYKGQTYVAKVAIAPAERLTPRLYTDVSRHCVECALTFIPQIVVVGDEVAA